MKLLEAIAPCIEEARIARRLAVLTQKAYRWHCTIFCQFTGALDASDLTSEHICAHLRHLQMGKEDGGAGYAPRSIRAHWHALAFFCRWLTEEGHVAANPMPSREMVTLPKLRVPIRHTTSPDQVGRLLGAAAHLPPWYRERARVVVYLLATAAVRHGELLRLRVSHVSTTEGYLKVYHGKGDRGRTLYLPADAIEAVAKWLLVRPEARHDRLLCQRDRIRALGNQGLRNLLRDLAKRAGIENSLDILPHAMRRGAACRLLENGFDIRAVSEVLGHSSMNTTQMYLSTSSDRLRQLAPLAGLGAPSEPSDPLPPREVVCRPRPKAMVRPSLPAAPPVVFSTRARIPLWEQQELLRRIQRQQKGAGQ